MARRQTKQLIEVLDNAEQLNEWIERSDQVLVVVDLFDKWCGYCSVLEPTYNLLSLEIDDFTDRVKLFALEKSKLTDELLESFPPVQPGCKPMLLVFKHKVVIGKVNGANAPELSNLVTENVFPLQGHEE